MGERRSTGEHKYYLSNLPTETPLKILAVTIKRRNGEKTGSARRLMSTSSNPHEATPVTASESRAHLLPRVQPCPGSLFTIT